MNGPNLLVALAAQLATQAPALLAYVVGIFLALHFWNRAPRPSLHVLLGCLILLVTSIGMTALTMLVVQTSRGTSLGNVWGPAWMLSFVNLLGGLLRATGIGLLLAAAFVDRDRRPMTPVAKGPPIDPDR